jgi:hypothetical protein
MSDYSKRIPILLAILFLIGGFGIRMLDLKDPPLDFHPSRQLFSYTIARGLYYKLAPQTDPEIRDKAIRAGENTDRYEPRIQEGILALFYLISGGERFWIARVMTTTIWIAAGWVLYKLASRLSTARGALFSLAYFLFLPFAVQASRSFQPEVLMVFGVVSSAYALQRWNDEDSWVWTIAVGVIAGMTVLVKAQAIFPVAMMGLFVVLSKFNFMSAIKDPKVLVMACLMAVIPGVYYLGPWVPGGSSYFRAFTVAMSGLLSDPGFFVRWANFIHGFMDMGVIVLALIGSLLMKKPGRMLMLGLWSGYLVLGFFFPWQIHTHDYYSLVLVPIVGLGIAAPGAWFVEQISKQRWIWRAAFLGICSFAIAFPLWTARSALLGKDYRNEPAAWINMGQDLPEGASIIALTHDYGWRLQYWGFTPVTLWPYNADYELQRARGGNVGSDVEAAFSDRTEGFDYFLVTAYGELNGQPELKKILEGYPVAQRGDGYILYDLSNN